MKAIIIIGSGINYMLADMVKTCDQEVTSINFKTVYQSIVELNNLWGELENILSSTDSVFPSKNGEAIIQFYQTVFESTMFKNMLSSTLALSGISYYMLKMLEQRFWYFNHVLIF